MYIHVAPSSDRSLLNLNVPFKLILRRIGDVTDVWSENAALFIRLMKIHSNPLVLALRLFHLEVLMSLLFTAVILVVKDQFVNFTKREHL